VRENPSEKESDRIHPERAGKLGFSCLAPPYTDKQTTTLTNKQQHPQTPPARDVLGPVKEAKKLFGKAPPRRNPPRKNGSTEDFLSFKDVSLFEIKESRRRIRVSHKLGATARSVVARAANNVLNKNLLISAASPLTNDNRRITHAGSRCAGLRGEPSLLEFGTMLAFNTEHVETWVTFHLHPGLTGGEKFYTS